MHRFQFRLHPLLEALNGLVLLAVVILNLNLSQAYQVEMGVPRDVEKYLWGRGNFIKSDTNTASAQLSAMGCLSDGETVEKAFKSNGGSSETEVFFTNERLIWYGHVSAVNLSVKKSKKALRSFLYDRMGGFGIRSSTKSTFFTFFNCDFDWELIIYLGENAERPARMILDFSKEQMNPVMADIMNYLNRKIFSAKGRPTREVEQGGGTASPTQTKLNFGWRARHFWEGNAAQVSPVEALAKLQKAGVTLLPGDEEKIELAFSGKSLINFKERLFVFTSHRAVVVEKNELYYNKSYWEATFVLWDSVRTIKVKTPAGSWLDSDGAVEIWTDWGSGEVLNYDGPHQPPETYADRAMFEIDVQKQGVSYGAVFAYLNEKLLYFSNLAPPPAIGAVDEGVAGKMKISRGGGDGAFGGRVAESVLASDGNFGQIGAAEAQTLLEQSLPYILLPGEKVEAALQKTISNEEDRSKWDMRIFTANRILVLDRVRKKTLWYREFMSIPWHSISHYEIETRSATDLIKPTVTLKIVTDAHSYTRPSYVSNDVGYVEVVREHGSRMQIDIAHDKVDLFFLQKYVAWRAAVAASSSHAALASQSGNGDVTDINIISATKRMIAGPQKTAGLIVPQNPDIGALRRLWKQYKNDYHEVPKEELLNLQIDSETQFGSAMLLTAGENTQEQLLYTMKCGNDFIGITTFRLIYVDRNSVAKLSGVNLRSYPYNAMSFVLAMSPRSLTAFDHGRIEFYAKGYFGRELSKAVDMPGLHAYMAGNMLMRGQGVNLPPKLSLRDPESKYLTPEVRKWSTNENWFEMKNLRQVRPQDTDELWGKAKSRLVENRVLLPAEEVEMAFGGESNCMVFTNLRLIRVQHRDIKVQSMAPNLQNSFSEAGYSVSSLPWIDCMGYELVFASGWFKGMVGLKDENLELIFWIKGGFPVGVPIKQTAVDIPLVLHYLSRRVTAAAVSESDKQRNADEEKAHIGTNNYREPGSAAALGARPNSHEAGPEPRALGSGSTRGRGGSGSGAELDSDGEPDSESGGVGKKLFTCCIIAVAVMACVGLVVHLRRANLRSSESEKPVGADRQPLDNSELDGLVAEQEDEEEAETSDEEPSVEADNV